MFKRWIKYIFRFFIGIFILITLLLFVSGVLFMIPSVQTKAAKKAASYLSKEMQTEITIDKLQIAWNLDILVKNAVIEDQHGRQMIAIKQAFTHFPKYDIISRTLHFPYLTVDSAGVLIANYKDETHSNISFFTNFFKSDKPDKKGMDLHFRNVKMTNSNFEFLNERHPREEIAGVWNYSDIRFSDIQLKMQAMDISNGYLNMDIGFLSLKEYSGFVIDSLYGKISIGKDRIYSEKTWFVTPDGTDADFDFRFDFNNYKCFSSFYDSVCFNCSLRPSSVSVKDLKYFVKNFAEMKNDIIHLQANVNQPLSKLRIENINFSYKDSCLFKGDIITEGLPHAKQTIWEARLHQFALSTNSLNGFILPKGKVLNIPAAFKNLSLYNGILNFSGSFQDFVCDADLKSNAGDLQINGLLNGNSSEKKYQANFRVNELAVNKFTSSPVLEKLTANGFIQGSSNDIDEYHLHINTIYINGCPIHQCNVNGDMEDGRLTMIVQSDDRYLDASIKGFVDLLEENRPCYTTFNIKNVDLSALQLFRPDSNATLSMKGSLQMNLTSLEHMEGNASIENFVYREQDHSYPLHNVNVLLSQKEQETRMQFFSTPIRVFARGNIPLQQLSLYVKQWLHTYLPQTVNCQQQRLEKDSHYFDARIHIADKQDILNTLFPTVHCLEPVHLSADQNGLQLNAAALTLNKNLLQDLKAEVIAEKDTAKLQASCGQFIWNRNDSLSNLKNISFTGNCYRDTLPFRLSGEKNDGNSADITNLDLQGVLLTAKEHLDLMLDKGQLCFDKELFMLDSSNLIRFEKGNIQIKSLNFVSEKSSLAIQGNYSSHLPMNLNANINNLNLGELGWLMKPYKLEAEGIANGKLHLIRDNSFQFVSQLDISQFVFNEVFYDKMQLQTNWDDLSHRVAINVTVQTDTLPAINMTGDYNPQNRHIDLKGDIKKLDLKSLSPFLASFTTDVNGEASGKLQFAGPINAAIFTGDILIEKADLRIDYLQTYYHINRQPLAFTDSGFVFKQMHFTDDYGNRGELNGIVSHKHLKNWGVQLDVDMQHAMVLNTQYKDNDLFYGRAFVSGRVHLSQSGNLFNVTGDARTESPTFIVLSLTRNTNVRMQNNYIVFEKPYTFEEDEKEEDQTKSSRKKSITRLMLNLSATPDAMVRVNLDPSIGCSIEGGGNGNLRLEINDKQKFEIYGSYTLSEGMVNLALGNILTRSLKLENGSYLSWNGRPDNGQMDVKATYTTKTSISSLLNESATSSYRTIPITTCLNLNGNLLNPDFDFNIRMDDVDESIQSVVYNVLDTTNKDEMLQQAFSLLLTGRLSVGENRAESVNYGIGYSLSEFSSYYLQKMISSLTDKVNLGFQYIQGDGTSIADEYNVQISTNLMENRLSIQGNLNIYGDNDGMLEQQAVAGNVVGDIIFEYKITKDGSLRIKAFNMANYYDVLSSAYSDVPYYQGVGVAFSKDFNHLKDLFHKKNK